MIRPLGAATTLSFITLSLPFTRLGNISLTLSVEWIFGNRSSYAISGRNPEPLLVPASFLIGIGLGIRAMIFQYLLCGIEGIWTNGYLPLSDP